MCWYKNKVVLPLDAYRKEVKALKDLALTELTENMKEDEILVAVIGFRDDDDLTDTGIWSKAFKNPQNMLAYIQEMSSSLEEDGIKPAKERMWWDVDRYKLSKDGEYEEYMDYSFSTDGKVLGYSFKGWGHSKSEREQDLDEGEYLLKSPHNVILPYRTGDILKVNTLPFTKPVYIVYGGKGDVADEKIMEPYDYYHWCLYRSEDRDGLDIADLSDSYFLDYGHNWITNIGDCEKAERCPDPLLTKASSMLRENPDLWYEWFMTRMEHRLDEGGLEQWIFTD